MYEQLPKSDTSNIKVKLLVPSDETDENYTITSANNIKWKFTLEPGQSILKVLQYCIEFPSDKEIELTQ